MATNINGGGGSGPGTNVQPGLPAPFKRLQFLATEVANAAASPTDSPTVDTMLVQADATPRIFIWWYRESLDDWYGVELTA